MWPCLFTETKTKKQEQVTDSGQEGIKHSYFSPDLKEHLYQNIKIRI